MLRLYAQESADVTNQYYRSATSGNSRINGHPARGMKSDGRAARLPGNEVWWQASLE